MTTRFITNRHTSGRGFWIEVTRKLGTCKGEPPRRGCDRQSNESSFTLTSPKHPNSYPPNADCVYTIERSSPDVCALRLRFDHFDLESVSGCFYDHLQLSASEKLCGRLAGGSERIIPFASHERSKQWRFHSDGQVGRSGFRLSIHQETKCELPPPPSCAVCTSERHGTLTSYGYPDPYRNLLHCSYTVERADARMCGVQLDFDEFGVSPSAGCSADYLQIAGRRYCGTTLHSARKVFAFDSVTRTFAFGADEGDVQSRSNATISTSDENGSIRLLFVTDQNSTAKGFLARYRQIPCTLFGSGNYRPDEGHDGHPVSGHSVASTPQMPQMPMEDRTTSGDRPNPPNTVRDRETLYPEQRRMNSKTNLDDDSELEQKKLNDRQLQNNPIAPVCQADLSEKHFLLKSPLTNENTYPNNLNCEFQIRKNTSRVCYIELSFLKFDVEASAQCQFDFLEVNNVRLCGSLQKPTTRTYIFSDDAKVVRFKSDSSTSRAGFIIRGEQLECKGDAIIRPPLETIMDQHTQQQMHSNQSNRSQMNEPKDYQIKSPPSSTSIKSDQLNGEVRHPPSLHYITQLQSRPQHSPQQPQHFEQQHEPTRPQQYPMSVDTGVVSCESSLFSDVVFQLRSPGFPSQVPFGLQCEHVVRKKRIEVCQLEMHVIEFHLGPSSNCSSDQQLNFNGQALCGHLPAKSVKFFPFPGDEFKITLKTPNVNSPIVQSKAEYAYLLQMRQRECPNMMMINRPLAPAQADIADLHQKPAVNPSVDGSIKSSMDPITYSKPIKTSTDISSPNRVAQNTYQATDCDQQFDQNSFEIQMNPHLAAGSQNHPMHCTFTIRKSHGNICALQVKLMQLQMAPLTSTGCSGDFLLLNGQRFCAEVRYPLVRRLPFIGSIASIQLHLSEPGSKQMHARVEQLDCSGDVKGHAHSSGTSTPSKSNQVPIEQQHTKMKDDETEQTKKQTIEPVMDVPSHTQTSTGNDLNNERQRITSVQLDNTTKSGEYVGSSMRPVDQSRAPSICELCFTELSGEITSYAYPNVYPDNVNCNYKITGQPNFCGVYIRFDAFNLPSASMVTSSEPDPLKCDADYVELNGIRYCGDQLLNIKSKRTNFVILFFYF